MMVSILAVWYLHSQSTRHQTTALQLQSSDHFFAPFIIATSHNKTKETTLTKSLIPQESSRVSIRRNNQSSSISTIQRPSSATQIIMETPYSNISITATLPSKTRDANRGNNNTHHHDDPHELYDNSTMVPSFYQALTLPFQSHSFPRWIQDYITWHYDMRQLYPGALLWTHPKAPHILLRYCVHKCGGLQDRLGNLPTDLYLAYSTKRIYLMTWLHPFRLEDFVQPHSDTTSSMGGGAFLNWSVPQDAPNLWTRKQVLQHVDLFHRNPTMNVSLAIHQATVGDLANEKVLLTRHLGCLHEQVLERHLQQDPATTNDNDMIHHTPTFGKLFHALFVPSYSLARRLQEVTTQLQLKPYQYAAVHCRVRHPGGYKYGKVIIGKLGPQGKVVGSADQVGLDFTGEIRQHAIAIATHAVQCTTTMLQMIQLETTNNYQQVPPSAKNFPIYFLADSEELVNYMVHHVSNDTVMAPILMAGNVDSNLTNNHHPTTINETIRTELQARHVVAQTRLLSRPLIHPSVHLDRQKNVSLEAVQDIFVDLYLAMGANCVSFGIGNFGYFVSKLSYYARTCRWQYQLTVSGKSNDFLKRNLTNRLPTSVCTKETLPQLQEQVKRAYELAPP
jgi:hypothetical protein